MKRMAREMDRIERVWGDFESEADWADLLKSATAADLPEARMWFERGLRWARSGLRAFLACELEGGFQGKDSPLSIRGLAQAREQLEREAAQKEIEEMLISIPGVWRTKEGSWAWSEVSENFAMHLEMMTRTWRERADPLGSLRALAQKALLEEESGGGAKRRRSGI